MKNFLTLLFCLVTAVSYAQDVRLNGTVVNKNTQEPIANVTVTSPLQSVMTDSVGKFTITATVGKPVSFSHISMNPLSVDITSDKTQLLIQMEEQVGTGQQVIVVGYSTQRKQDVTGSVAVVDLNPVKNTSSGNTMQALQGRVAGLYIEKDGSPNGSNSRILIRGANTLGNTDPLYIIDGVPTTRPEVFQNLNPASIASVQILKDASAASIYGSRASNGVVIVTTKNGGNTEGKVAFQFNTSISSQSEKYARYEMLNAVDRGKALWQASVNDRINPVDAYGEIYNFDWNNNFDNPVLNSVTPKQFVGGDQNVPVGNTDWQDVMYKTGIVSNSTLNASVGNKNSSMEINLGYLKNTGMLRYTGYDRLSGGINAITKSFDNRLIFGVNFNIASSNETLATRDIGGAPTTFLAVTLAPTIPVYKKDGVTFAGPVGGGYSDRNNPLHMQYLARWNNANRLSAFGNVFAEIQIIKNLFFKSNIGADNAFFQSKVIEPSFNEYAPSRSTNSLAYNENKYFSLTVSNTLRYNLNAGENRFKFLIGTEQIKTDLDTRFTKKEGFSLQTEDYFTMDAGTGKTTALGSSTGNRLFSQFARLDYSYSDRYLAAITVRRDGSSRFGTENQYGIFPAASLGWRIDREAFMRNSNLFSELKLRVGAGRVGNQQIGDIARFLLFATRYGTTQNELTPGFWEQYMNIGTAYSLSGANTGSLPSGFAQIQAANPKLKWETTDEINAGIDFSILKNQIYGSFDYFSRNTTGILIVPPVASALGEGKQRPVNGASKTNKGWEFVLGYRNSRSADIGYTVQLNLAHFRDKITELPEEVRPAYPGNLLNTIIGHSQFDLFGYKTNGIFQTQAEVDAAPTQVGAGPGRIRYVDINSDGVIDDDDRTWIGTTLPKLEYGTRVDLNHKNFDVSFFGSGIAGRKGYDAYTDFNNLMKSRENVGPGVLNAWSPKNTSSNIPALTLKDNNNERRTSDYFIVSTSYFKIRNLQVGYSLPPHKFFSRLRLFIMGENLLVLKNKSYLSPDPERISMDPIPVPRSFTFGINASF